MGKAAHEYVSKHAVLASSNTIARKRLTRKKPASKGAPTRRTSP